MEEVKIETGSQAQASNGAAQSEPTAVANEPAATEKKEELELPKTVEDYRKALQSASSTKMNEFLKKYGAAKLSDIEERLSKVSELETKIKDGEATQGEAQKWKDEVAKLQKIIDEQTPIVTQKKQADFLQQNNIKPEFAEDFFALYEKKLNDDKSNSSEVIKSILERHPQMGALKINEIKTAGKSAEKKEEADGLDKIRRHLGLPPKNL